jgi:hypothetical protein
MGKMRRLMPAMVALLLAFLCSSCIVRGGLRPLRRKRDQKTGKVLDLKSATRDELNARITRIYNSINSFQATVDMTPSVGSVYKGQITEYKDVRAFVLFRKEAEIRIIAQYPVVRTTAFDMVSNGTDFRFLLVSKNLFVTGSDAAPATSKNTLENLRPEAFLGSMLIRPADPSLDISVLVDNTDEENALYTIVFLRKAANGDFLINRDVWFDRTDLSIVRQRTFDESATIVSDTRYGKWASREGSLFPGHIDINRPKDGYGVVMDVTEVKMNLPLTDDKFILNQPEGAIHQIIGAGGGTK